MKGVQGPLVSCTQSTQQPFYQTGYCQSFSGSETDVSTSTENLSAEERNVLQRGERQDPQGEETLIEDMDSSLSNTLIIRNNSSIDGFTSPFYGKTSNFSSRPIGSVQEVSSSLEKNSSAVAMRLNSNSPSSGSPGSVPASPKCGPRRQGGQNVYSGSSSGSGGIRPPSTGSPYSGGQVFRFDPSVQEITEIPKHYLDQSEVLKHLAKEMHHHQKLRDLPPPPEYPRWRVSGAKKSDNSGGGSSMENKAKRLSISRSHPDLTKLDSGKASEKGSGKVTQLSQRPKTRGRAAVEVDSEAVASKMIAVLSEENTALKAELDMYYSKVSKLQKFELELQKFQQAHEELVRSSDKREKLDRTMRARLEMELMRIQETNRELKAQLDAAMSQLSKRPITDYEDSELKKEVSRRDVLIAQLLSQNKELLAEKERKDIELQAQRATLQEQRNHIDILDNALNNAQANVVKLEEECRKKQFYVERVNQLQRALADLQLASERRLQMEKRFRIQLEKDLENLTTQKNEGRGTGNKKESEDVEQIKRAVREYEEKIIALEAEVAKWEQRYLEESAMRQIAVDAASVPKDAKIAALERTSQESEKLIARERSEKLKQMDDLYASQRKCAEQEGKIKDLESRLAEKDAMIKVLQQHSQEKDAVLQNAVLGRPPRHTRAASSVTLSSTSPSTTIHRRTGSKDEIGSSSLASVVSSESTNPSGSCATTTTTSSTNLDSKKSLDEQLKELGSRLSNKDSIINALRTEKERHPSHFWRV